MFRRKKTRLERKQACDLFEERRLWTDGQRTGGGSLQIKLLKVRREQAIRPGDRRLMDYFLLPHLYANNLLQ